MDISCSLITAEQHATTRPTLGIPLFTGGVFRELSGVIFRPGDTTRILCGSASDSGGGACKRRCPSVSNRTLSYSYDPTRDGRDGCHGGSWSPEDFGTYLDRWAQWQRVVQSAQGFQDYNEIIVDGPYWTRHLPRAIEAFFGTSVLAHTQHRAFLAAFNLTNHDVPLLSFDQHDWHSPFGVVADAMGANQTSR